MQHIIESLESMGSETEVRVHRPGKRRGRKSMDEKAREEVSARMKRYWARRRAEQSSGAGG